jgi:excisionase family DNA binding protein
MSTFLLTPQGAAQFSPLLLTVPQAARVLAISRSAVYRLIWNGDVTPVHIGRSVRLTVAELEQFVAARVQTMQPAP